MNEPRVLDPIDHRIIKKEGGNPQDWLLVYVDWEGPTYIHRETGKKWSVRT